MKTILLLVCIGGAYGILHIFIASQSAAGLLAWPTGVAFYLVAVTFAARVRRGVSVQESAEEELTPEEWRQVDTLMSGESRPRRENPLRRF